MVDSHIHTEFSDDSDMKLESALEITRKSGIGMIITEHLDLEFPTGTDFNFDIDKYFDKYEKYKSSKFMLGIEIGMQQICYEGNRDIANKYPFDYIIGSIHATNGEDIFNPEIYDGKTKKETFEQYFIDMLDCVKQYDFMDSLGHIDYISRYSTYIDNEINYHEFKDYIDEVLKAVVLNGKVIEINTRRLTDVAAYNNLIDIYRAYKQIGGKYVTIGSDAHHAKDIGNNFLLANRICEICNLKPVYFRNRNMEYTLL